MGGATGGERELAARSKAKSFAPRAGLLLESHSAHRAAFCGRRDPRRMRARSQLKSKSFAPRAGLLQERPQRAPSRLLWEPRPAANASSQPAQKQKLRPEGGAPTKKATARTKPPFVGGATRGECEIEARPRQKFAPRAGLLQRKPQRAPSRLFVGAATRGECELAARSKAKARPEGGALYESQARTKPPFVGAATRGECELAASSKAKARPEGGALYESQARTKPPFVGAAPRGECGLTAGSKAKASPRGRGSNKESHSAHRAAFPGRHDARQLPDPSKTKPRTRRGLSSSRPASGRACPRRLYQALIRDLYSPVRVSISIESPISQKAETCSSAPFFRRAVFMTLPEVSPRTDGSV